MAKFDGVLIASDLDGTLLTSDHINISKENLDAINYFRDNGGKFTVATGRPPISAKAILKVLNLKVPAVLLNGAIIYDLQHNKAKMSNCLQSSALAVAMDIVEKFPEIGCEVFTEDDIHMCSFSYASFDHFKKLGKPSELTSFENLPQTNDWFKLNFTNDDTEYLSQIEDYFEEHYGDEFQSCHSCKQFFEVTHLDARKDKGVLEVAKILGISSEHIYTIGDQFNDYDMIKSSKLGFATANAEDGVKEIADHIVGTCDEHAVAQMIAILDKIY